MVDFKKLMVASPKHSRLGPSGFKSVEICPSYVSDNSKESPAAISGTQLHAIMEKHGVKVKETEEYMTLDSGEKIECINKIATYLHTLEEGLGPSFKKHLEVQLDLTSYSIPWCEFGTADVVIEWHKGQIIEAIDYKFGWIEVDDAEQNIQAWLYVLGIFANYPKSRSVTFHILQPQRDEVSTFTFDRSDIPRLVLRAQTIAERKSKKSGLVFNPVVGNCNWCGNKAECTALHGFALKIAQKTTLEWPDDIADLTPQTLSSKNPKHLVEHSITIYHMAKIMETWVDQVKRRLTQLNIDGAEMRGLKLRTVQGRSSVVNIQDAIDLISKKFRVTKSEILAASADISLTKAENYVASLAPVGKKQSVKDELRDALEQAGLIYKGAPSAYLVDNK